jgi:hypothetical protein
MRIFCFSLLFIIVFSCNNNKTDTTKLVNFVPDNTSIILKTTNLENLKSSISNNDFIQSFSKSSSYKLIAKKLLLLEHLKPTQESLICLSKNAMDSLEYTFITKISRDLFITDSLPNYIEETLTYKNKTINISTLDKETFYSTVIDSIFMVSSSKTTIENAFNKKGDNYSLEKLYHTTSDLKTVSAIVNSDSDHFIKSFFIEDALTFQSLTNQMAIDVDINQNQININGITKASDTSKSIINLFKNTIPQENQVQYVVPSISDGYMSFTFNDYSIFESNLNIFHKKDSISNTSTLFDNIIEIGVIYEGENKAIVLNSVDIIATSDALISEQNLVDTYRQVDIFDFSKPHLFFNSLAPFIASSTYNKYCILDNFFIFGYSLESLQNIIANYQNKTTIGEQSAFKNIKEQLSDASSLMIVVNPSALKTILIKNNKELDVKSLNNYKVSALQFIYDTNFAHVNGIIKKTKRRSALHSVSEELHIKLDADLLNTPQLVTNHVTKEKDIVVQDINNNLYLISNKGKILWKKQLQGPVLGNIEQIDMYKNGRLQLVFATPNRVYVIDRKGNDVSPFPGKFNDKITQPLAVFDYDKKKNYRLLVTQDKQVLMYDVNLKIVKGFTFKSANKTIISQPQHFRIAGKDYILIKTGSKLYILDRIGKNRIKPKTSSTFSEESVYIYNNKFVTTTPEGNLVSIDTKGNTVIQNLNLSEAHHIVASSKTLVTQSENKLGIKNRTIEIDYGNYSKPDLFYINDKIYVSLTDLQSKKVYLYDSQAKLLPNFPVYGNSSILLDNINKGRALEFITKGESNSIILYQIN